MVFFEMNKKVLMNMSYLHGLSLTSIRMSIFCRKEMQSFRKSCFHFYSHDRHYLPIVLNLVNYQSSDLIYQTVSTTKNQGDYVDQLNRNNAEILVILIDGPVMYTTQ